MIATFEPKKLIRNAKFSENLALTQTSAYLKVSARERCMEWQTCSTVTPFLRMRPSSKSGGCPAFRVDSDEGEVLPQGLEKVVQIELDVAAGKDKKILKQILEK